MWSLKVIVAQNQLSVYSNSHTAIMIVISNDNVKQIIELTLCCNDNFSSKL